MKTVPESMPQHIDAVSKPKSNKGIKIALAVMAIIIVALCAVIFLLMTNRLSLPGAVPEVTAELKAVQGQTVSEAKNVADQQGYSITLIDYDTQKECTDRILNSDTKTKYYRVVKDDGIKAFSEADKSITYVVVAPLSESWDKWFTDADFNNSGANTTGTLTSNEAQLLGVESEADEKSDEPPTEEQERAITRAKDRLKVKSMSRQELIYELKTADRFEDKDAKYAADHCDANWEEQATKCANESLTTALDLNIHSFELLSYSKLLQSLENRGFSHEDAVKGIDNNHPDWNQIAEAAGIKLMKSYSYSYSYSSQSDEHITQELVNQGFTYEEATLGINAAKKYKEEHPEEFR